MARNNGNNNPFGATPVYSTAGLGGMELIPDGSTDGVPIGDFPDGAVGVRMYLPPSASVTFTVATSAPVTAPLTAVMTNGGTSTMVWDELLSGNAMLYIVDKSGAAFFRWY